MLSEGMTYALENPPDMVDHAIHSMSYSDSSYSSNDFVDKLTAFCNFLVLAAEAKFHRYPRRASWSGQDAIFEECLFIQSTFPTFGYSILSSYFLGCPVKRLVSHQLRARRPER